MRSLYSCFCWLPMVQYKNQRFKNDYILLFYRQVLIEERHEQQQANSQEAQLKTVRKALGLLELFSEAQAEFGLTEIATASRLNKATAHRMLTALAEHGLVEQDPKTRRYRVGVAVLRLANVRELCNPLLNAARPIMEKLMQQTGETTHMAAVANGSLRSLTYIESRQAIRVGMSGENILPFHGTASGIVYLAFSPESELERVLQAGLPDYTNKTLVDPGALRTAVTRAYEQGYATIDQGFEAGVFGLAAPIFNRYGEIQAALAVATPVTRMDHQLAQQQAVAVKRAAAEITRAVGGAIPVELEDRLAS